MLSNLNQPETRMYYIYICTYICRDLDIFASTGDYPRAPMSLKINLVSIITRQSKKVYLLHSDFNIFENILWNCTLSLFQQVA